MMIPVGPQRMRHTLHLSFGRIINLLEEKLGPLKHGTLFQSLIHIISPPTKDV